MANLLHNKRVLSGVIVTLCAGLALTAGLLVFWPKDNPPPAAPWSASVRPQSNAAPQSFTFAAAGDFDATAEFAQVLAQIKASRPDFTLALGDLSYGAVPEHNWCDRVTSVLGPAHPFELIAGNHDDSGGNGMHRFTECLPNRIPQLAGEYGRQYYFDYKNLARVIAISPDIEIGGQTYQYHPGTAPYQWLAERIDQAHAQGIPWVIAAMHKNCLTTGVKTCEIGQDVFDLLVQKRVDLILQGHEHAYFRSTQLAASAGCPTIPASFAPACVASPQAKSYRKGQGSVLVINGTGGTPLRDAQLSGPSTSYFASIHAQNAQPVYGPSVFVVSQDKLEARLVDTAGTVQDEFVIGPGGE